MHSDKHKKYCTTRSDLFYDKKLKWKVASLAGNRRSDQATAGQWRRSSRDQRPSNYAGHDSPRLPLWNDPSAGAVAI